MRISDWSSTCALPILKPTFNVLVAGDLQDPNPANRTRLTSFFVSDTLGAFDEKVELTLGLRRQQIYFRTYDITAGGEKTRYKDALPHQIVDVAQGGVGRCFGKIGRAHV